MIYLAVFGVYLVFVAGYVTGWRSAKARYAVADDVVTDGTDNACSCGATEDELNAVGRQLYICDECGAWCCSEHSENGPGMLVYCDECTGGRKK